MWNANNSEIGTIQHPIRSGIMGHKYSYSLYSPRLSNGQDVKVGERLIDVFKQFGSQCYGGV